jgi:hypothetical protein
MVVDSGQLLIIVRDATPLVKDMPFGSEFSGISRVFGMGTIFGLAEKFGTQEGKRDLTPSGLSAVSDAVSYSA